MGSILNDSLNSILFNLRILVMCNHFKIIASNGIKILEEAHRKFELSGAVKEFGFIMPEHEGFFKVTETEPGDLVDNSLLFGFCF